MKRLCLLVITIALSACTQSSDQSLDQAKNTGLRGIVNGEIAIGKYRNVGAILTAGRFTCTGTLITPSVVLTAAHCIDNGDSGNTLPDVTFTLEIGSGESARATDYRVHEDYFGNSFYTTLYDNYLAGIGPDTDCWEVDPDPDVDGDEYQDCFYGETLSGSDIALIKLNKRFDNFVAYELGTDNIAVNEALTVLGFGRDEREIAGVKRLGTMLSFGYFDSQIVDRSTMLDGIPKDNGYLITVPDSGEQVGCFGDSGSPLIKQSGQTTSIQGVLSLALFDDESYYNPTELFDTICNNVDGNAYISMDPYRDWIITQRDILDPPGTCQVDNDNFGGISGGCLHKGDGNVYSRAKRVNNTGVTPDRVGRAAASAYCEGLTEGGRDDWHLPTATELMNVAKSGGFETLELGDPKYYWYWSSASSNLSPDTGTAVRLSDGQTYVGYPLHLNYPLSVVCVARGNN